MKKIFSYAACCLAIGILMSTSCTSCKKTAPTGESAEAISEENEVPIAIDKTSSVIFKKVAPSDSYPYYIHVLGSSGTLEEVLQYEYAQDWREPTFYFVDNGDERIYIAGEVFDSKEGVNRMLAEVDRGINGESHSSYEPFDSHIWGCTQKPVMIYKPCYDYDMEPEAVCSTMGNRRPILGDCYCVVMGSYTELINAVKHLIELYDQGFKNVFSETFYKDGTLYYRIFADCFRTKNEANEFKKQLVAEGLQPWIVKNTYTSSELKREHIESESQKSYSGSSSPSSSYSSSSDDPYDDPRAFRSAGQVLNKLCCGTFTNLNGDITLRFRYSGLYANGQQLTGALLVESFDAVSARISCSSPYGGTLVFQYVQDMLVKELNTGEVYFYDK